jgi:hypothetical protein
MVSVETTPSDHGWECVVEVAEGQMKTRHAVRVRPADMERWGRADEEPEDLVRRAFTFLLAREPAGSILRSFEVADIQRYFPEFDREIRRP